MRFPSSGAALGLSFLMGWISLVAASSSNSGLLDNAADLYGKRCLAPQVRREWRTLTNGARAEWINAVKVSLDWGDERSEFGSTLADLTSGLGISVLGENPAQGICCPLPESRQLHPGRPVEQEQFHVRRCALWPSSCSALCWYDAQVPSRLQLHPH